MNRTGYWAVPQKDFVRADQAAAEAVGIRREHRTAAATVVVGVVRLVLAAVQRERRPSCSRRAGPFLRPQIRLWAAHRRKEAHRN